MYTYQYGGSTGKSYQLVEAKDLIVVRTKEPGDVRERTRSRSVRNVMSGMIPVAAFPEANVTVYQCVPTRSRGATVLRNEARRELKNDPNIQFAGRALKEGDSGRIVVYTENFFVQFKDSTKKSECKSILKSLGLKVRESFPFGKNAFFATAKEGTGLEIFSIAEKLLSKKEVMLCHPELVWERKHKSAYPLQWHLKKTKIRGRVIDQHVDVESAWKKTKGKGITIAVIDDGVDTRHESFKGKVVFPRDTIRNRDEALPQRYSENHGTACAGVACANGKKKASGVAPEAKLMPIRSGGLGSLAEAKAFIWAANNGADVISCSWGPADGDWWNPNDPLHRHRFDLPDSSRLAIDYAINYGRKGKGCVIVWAAGNGRENVNNDGYASHEKVIAVSACNDRGKRSVYSDFGQGIWCCFPSNDFNAPELNQPRPLTAGIWTTDRNGDYGYNEGGLDAETVYGDFRGRYTATFGGTSSACPGVAGIAALILSVNKELNWSDVKNIIRLSCDKIDTAGGRYDAKGHSVYYGYGRINANKAVTKSLGSSQPEVEPLSVTGVLSFTKQGDVAFESGKWIGEKRKYNRLLGVQLELSLLHPELQLEYDVRFTKQKTSGWKKAGEYAGHTDRRRKLIGLRMRLTGEAASNYQLEYETKVYKRKTALKAKNGEWCASGSKRIEQVKINVKSIN